MIVIINPVWKLFDLASSAAIQAFIFALLTILYFDIAMSGAHEPPRAGADLQRLHAGPGRSDHDLVTTQKENQQWHTTRPSRRSSWLAPWWAAAWPSAAARSARPSVTAWPAARPSPAWPASPRPRARLFTIMFLTVGLVEAMYFINLAFTALFIFSLYKK